MAITNEQLAELLVGIARSQQAIIDATALHLGQQDGQAFRGRAVVPTLQGVANVLNHGTQPTLRDIPSRVLLQLQGDPRSGAQRLEEWVAQELTRILG
ncbi:hypothetical protein [Burkholderia ubonensis]|uniref:hypothetical protein n=1 Tax=Burkholderia ubonensis TaxID=101571 RepID=UPI0009B2F61D|nr:hypothetical protein [Burkholderia ubonensis]